MTEAVVVIELIASIASLVELTVKIASRLYDFIFKFSEVFEAFFFLSIRLSLLTIIFQLIQS